MTAVTIALAAVVAVVAMCLLFGVWLVRRHGPSALRDAAVFLRAIPRPTIRVTRRGGAPRR